MPCSGSFACQCHVPADFAGVYHGGSPSSSRRTPISSPPWTCPLDHAVQEWSNRRAGRGALRPPPCSKPSPAPARPHRLCGAHMVERRPLRDRRARTPDRFASTTPRQSAAALRGFCRRSCIRAASTATARADRQVRGGSSTDFSRAIDFATRLALAAPYVSRRAVAASLWPTARARRRRIREPQRDRAMAAGVVISGLDDRRQMAWPATWHISGGTGWFVMQVAQPAARATRWSTSSCAIGSPAGQRRRSPRRSPSAARKRGAAAAAPATGGTSSRQPPIRPPSSLVIATTDGRGGTPSAKSGQRVDGFSKVEAKPPPPPGAARRRTGSGRPA